MRARLRSAAGLLACLACALGCPQRSTHSTDPIEPTDPTDPTDGSPTRDPVVEREPPDEPRKTEGDPRVDPSRCTGDGLELDTLAGAGLCTIPVADARALPGPEQLELSVPQLLSVGPGERLEFALVLRNLGAEPIDVDLRFRRFLPLAPESTQTLDGVSTGLDESCTLQAISSDPPPERITLPPGAELAIACEWWANTRLVNPDSYVGSECRDFPELAPGRYRSVFRIDGGAGSQREAAVEIEVRP